MTDYSIIDNPLLLRYLFYPRKDFNECTGNAFDLMVPVEEKVSISCRLYITDKTYPCILYFHGNGEVVSDYDDIAPFYSEKGLNLVVADYRGYGASGGYPGFENLIKDAHSIFKAVRDELSERGCKQGLWIMGRSMGSISALELAYHYPDVFKGLIIESGFISAVRLIRHFQLPSLDINLDKLDQECVDLVGGINIPVLIIHGQHDTLVPLPEAKSLFENIGTEQRELFIIPYADHNNIMFLEPEEYFGAIKRFINETV